MSKGDLIIQSNILGGMRCGKTNARIKDLEAENAELRERLAESYVIIKAVAHIGIDWGYGKYEIEQHHIDNARKIYEDLIKQITGDL